MILTRIPEEFQPKPVKGAAAFSKGISVLQLIATAESPPNLADLVRISELPRPTLHRLIKALEAERLVESTSDKRYIVGSRLIQFAGRAIEQSDVIKLAEPELAWLRDKTNETIHLAIRDGHEMVYIRKWDSPQAIRLGTSVGGRVKLHSTALGKAVLAFMQPEQRDAIVDNMDMPRLTRYTTTDPILLRHHLNQIHTQGYSISHQESELEIQCYGCPIVDRAGLPVAGISISVPTYRLKNNEFYVRPLVETCRRISMKMGCKLRPQSAKLGVAERS